MPDTEAPAWAIAFNHWWDTAPALHLLDTDFGFAGSAWEAGWTAAVAAERKRIHAKLRGMTSSEIETALNAASDTL